MVAPASDPSPEPRATGDGVGEVRLRCACGSVAEGTGEGHQRETDARVECDDCSRLYIVTVTRVCGPDDD